MKARSLSKAALLVGIAVTAGALDACGRQQPEGAAQPAPEQTMSEKESTAGEGSMQGMPMSDATMPAANSHKTTGRIQTIDHAAGTVKIAHQAVPSLNWPAMTMGFKVQDESALAGLKEGEEVEFTFTKESADRYVITEISPRQ